MQPLPDLAKDASVVCYERAVDYITNWEGFKSEAYYDHGRWSIGHGTKSFKGERINEMEAKQRLRSYVRKTYARVATHRSTCEQRIALTSLAYNIGWPRFERSLVWKYHTQNRQHLAANAFINYKKAGGKVLNGLVKRRRHEQELYSYGTERLLAQQEEARILSNE